MMSMNLQHLITPRSQITRRDLFTLAVVSPSLPTTIRRGWPPAGMLEEFLSEVTASVTTCWYLLQGNDLTIIEVTLPLYLPELETLVKSTSRYRRRAAYLAAQGFLQRGLVALHHLHFAQRVTYCQKAVEYASASGDLTLLVTCLIHLSGAFRENGQLTDM